MPAEKKPSILAAMLTMKCPSCRKSHVFVNKSMFPLGQLVELKDECEVCGEKLKSEKNNGGGINYALTMLLFFLNLLWYWPIFGLSYKDEPGVLGGANSVFYYLTISTFVVVLAQPFLMRLSRMIYLYLYIGFGHSRRVTE
ncbi:MAG: hypothetical protein K0Q79_978 [Flavipsychrobacter sp.]|nr:hypothetical protein [Flavipsychrobacter sp.]